MIYLYGIVDAGVPPGNSGSSRAGSFEIVHHRGIGAAIALVSPRIQHRNEENFWAHHEVIMELADKYTVLPVQFGTVLKNRGAIRELLRRYEDRFRASLSRLRGKVEMGVKVLWSPPEPGARKLNNGELGGGPLSGPGGKATGGKAFLLSRYLAKRDELQLEQGAFALGSRVNKDIAMGAVENRPGIRPRGKLLLNGAYLVPAGHVDYFKTNLIQVKNKYADFKFMVSGPWPPYNFVQIKCF